MPAKPDGSPARTEKVVFTRPAAERIAAVVRTVEGGNRDGAALRFGARIAPKNVGQIRICTFTGAWSVETDKTVTFKHQTTTPNTVSASNLFWPIPNGPERDCAIAKDGTAWYLVVPQMYAANFATSATVTASAIEFKTLPGVAMATSSTEMFSIPITTCNT